MRWAGWVAAALAICACGGATGSASPPAPDGGAASNGPADAGPDAGPVTTDDCTGVVPVVPSSALAFDITAPGRTCVLATTDGAGTIAAESHAVTFSGDAAQISWSEFTARGTLSGSFSGGMLAPQASGFIDLVGNATALSLFLWDSGGTPRSTQPAGDGGAGIVLAPGFSAGAIVLRNSGASVQVASFDEGLNPVATASVATSATLLAAAQDRGGQVLAVLAGGQAIWIDLAAGTSSAPFQVGNGTAAVARALNGGGVAVRLDGHWTAVVQPGSSTLAAALSWMADGSDFSRVEGGKAYAVIAGGNTVSVAVGRTSCGSITLQGAASVSVGLDGTVIGSTGATGCSKIFWPRLFQ